MAKKKSRSEIKETQRLEALDAYAVMNDRLFKLLEKMARKTEADRTSEEFFKGLARARITRAREPKMLGARARASAKQKAALAQGRAKLKQMQEEKKRHANAVPTKKQEVI